MNDSDEDELTIAVSECFDFIKQHLFDKINQSDLITESFEFSKSLGIFSINLKGIMIIKVKVSYLKEGDAFHVE